MPGTGQDLEGQGGIVVDSGTGTDEVWGPGTRVSRRSTPEKYHGVRALLIDEFSAKT